MASTLRHLLQTAPARARFDKGRPRRHERRVGVDLSSTQLAKVQRSAAQARRYEALPAARSPAPGACALHGSPSACTTAPHQLSAVPATRAQLGLAGVPAQLSAATRARRAGAQPPGPSPSARAAALPTRLRAGIEALSGVDLSDVQVHANSEQPERLDAFAYARGNQIHLARGQEHHLPHEAWHLVQQRQGRVQAKRSVSGVPVEDSGVLEREADTMGARALQAAVPSSAAVPLQAPVAQPATQSLAQAPAQLAKHVKRSTGKVEEVGDDYALKWGEKFVAAPAPAVPAPVVAPVAEAPPPPPPSQAEREAAERAAAERAAEERAAAERAAALKERERQLKLYPQTVTRTDRNFSSATNSRGQGKAHLLDTGLAPAGDTQLRTVDQLVQDAPNKGSSNLISFTGPAPENPVEYGGNAAEQLTLKTRKLARAKAKGKPDVQHIDVHTSAALQGHIGHVRNTRKPKPVLRSFVRKDDEHQVRVGASATHASIIPKRFLYGAGLAESHDSDSDDDH